VVAAVAAAIRGDENADVKKLVGRDGIRIRAGSWRVIAAVEGDVMEIRRVASRGDVYKG
jgi:mRNA-degrading endonuclease RelE of RelBE toxin-antitoxin system